MATTAFRCGLCCLQAYQAPDLPLAFRLACTCGVLSLHVLFGVTTQRRIFHRPTFGPTAERAKRC